MFNLWKTFINCKSRLKLPLSYFWRYWFSSLNMQPIHMKHLIYSGRWKQHETNWLNLFILIRISVWWYEFEDKEKWRASIHTCNFSFRTFYATKNFVGKAIFEGCKGSENPFQVWRTISPGTRLLGFFFFLATVKIGVNLDVIGAGA